MMNRYHQQPQFRGRAMKNFIQSKGKRHYWGLKGKNYGFYTTNDQIEMEERRRQHRRLKSEYDNYCTIPNDHHFSTPKDAQYKRLSTEPISKFQRNSEKKISEYSPTQQTNPEGRKIINEKLKNELNNQRLRHLNLSQKNVDINLEPKGVKLPEIQRSSLPDQWASMNESRDYNQSRFQRRKEGTVVYYTKRDRSLNPTFCNSPAYPLPCYRYLA